MISLRSPLHYSAQNGHLSVVKYLVSHGANINGKNIDGWTPLHYSAHNGHLCVVEYLVDSGADISITNNANMTPLMISTQNNIVQYLISQGDINYEMQ